MQFQVPQFIDVAPKIVGPLTLEQFLYIAAGVVPSFLLYFALAFWLWIIIAIILCSGGAALAFMKINGQPLRRVGFSAFNYFWKPRLYLWQRLEEAPVLPQLPRIPHLEMPKQEEPPVPGEEPKPKPEPRQIQTEGKKPIEIRGMLEKLVEVPTAPLKNLLLQMTTSKAPIPKREKRTAKFLDDFALPKQEFETLRKTAGDRGVAKRVDYRD